MAYDRKKIEKRILTTINLMDPSGDNGRRYVAFFKSLNDKQFLEYGRRLKNKEIQIYIIAPNLKTTLSMNNILKAGNELGTKLFHRIWQVDPDTGQRVLSIEEYPVLNTPLKRMQQVVDKKLSVSPSDARVDATTGAISEQDKSSGISNPEIQCLYAQGLDVTLQELLKVRGGDMHAYNEFTRQLEETGEASMDRISKDSTTRSVVVTDVYFKTMHFKTNFSNSVGGVAHE